MIARRFALAGLCLAASVGAQEIRGTWIAAATFVLWGVMPLYWHLLKAVPSLQIVLHRIAWRRTNLTTRTTSVPRCVT